MYIQCPNKSHGPLHLCHECSTNFLYTHNNFFFSGKLRSKALLFSIQYLVGLPSAFLTPWTRFGMLSTRFSSTLLRIFSTRLVKSQITHPHFLVVYRVGEACAPTHPRDVLWD